MSACRGMAVEFHVSQYFNQNSFFFHGSDDLRDLHSFPTRRSSDLRSPSRGRARRGGRARSRPGRSACGRSPAGRARPSLISEEHTSELQSLRHLVCRLLLEKKNNKKSDMDLAAKGLGDKDWTNSLN